MHCKCSELSYRQTNTVDFFKLDRRDCSLEGKMRKIFSLTEITSSYTKVVMVQWLRHWSLTWQARVQSPSEDFTIFLPILQFSQILRGNSRFQQGLARLGPFPLKSKVSKVSLHINKTPGTWWYICENWGWKLHFSRSKTDKKWSWVRIPHFPMSFWALNLVLCT